mmetsp:Transcript_57764/g.137512  ORF Transcript_57764/g.137512 Transcript_57764/m.137512 type:complete len:83 (+) Transcript_57764:87-335(+)
MTGCHMSDSVFCHRHRWKVGLLEIIDSVWKSEALPDDDIVLPDGQHISLDEADDKSIQPGDKGEEKWSELPLTQLLEDEAEA